ncbi:hypothetical protein [Gaiella sp.]|jgi:AbrB family looped-hinge helix DNA binding protein|uniref:hypothetical protein n=1 Tax=Gaiella sp. TaxID=2663207 RepID=UPI002E31AAFC|nr:hypothetical protein [Gaiella sp.]HEX5584523.1 hypothetical protein [Gaiella sp.]
MSNYRITTSGQVSIPADVRRRWGTRRVRVEDRGDHLVVRPLPDDPIDALAGIWRDRMKKSTDELRAQAREEEADVEARKLREHYGIGS